MKNQNILEAEITNLIVETFSRLYGNYEVFIDQQKRFLLGKKTRQYKLHQDCDCFTTEGKFGAFLNNLAIWIHGEFMT